MLHLDIEVPRNADYIEHWQLLDRDGEPIDLTTDTLTASARNVAGGASVIASATITKDAGADGLFTMLWRGSDFDGFGGKMQVVRAAYDLKQTFSDGLSRIVCRGHLIIHPEVTI